MKIKGFFSEQKFNISLDNVFFSNTRKEKIQQISKLNLDAFVDDLVEVYSEPGFPGGIKKIILNSNKQI